MRGVFSVVVMWVFCVAILKFSAVYLHKDGFAAISDYVFMAGAIILIGSLMIRGLRNYNLSQKKPRTIPVSYTRNVTPAAPEENKA